MNRILILGEGLVGKSIKYHFSDSPNVIKTCGSKDLDLRELSEVKKTLYSFKPNVVIFAAGVSGGIEANYKEPGYLSVENLLILSNFLYAAQSYNLQKLINIVPACVYPSNLDRKLKPEDLFAGPMEKSSLGYSSSKLAGLVTAKSIASQYRVDWKSVIVTNLYGKKEESKGNNLHVIPDLVRKIKSAKQLSLEAVYLLGNGYPVRDFLHVRDLGAAIETILNSHSNESIINVNGTGEITIAELARKIAMLLDYHGELKFAESALNGADYKVLDGTYIQSLGWAPKISLDIGLEMLINGS